MKAKYPTFFKMASDCIVSEEQLFGTPDYILSKPRKSNWLLKFRSSAKWMDTGELTAAKAMQFATAHANNCSGQAA